MPATKQLLPGVSERIYGALLVACPRSFRAEYGPLMRQAYRDQARAALRTGQAGALAKVWWRALKDLAATAVREHAAPDGAGALRPTNLLFCSLLGVTLAAVGYIDMVASDMQAIVLVLLAGAFVLGAVRARRVWRWAFLMSLSILATEICALAVGLEPAGFAHARAVHPRLHLAHTWANAAESLFSLVPALLAAYLGMAANKVLMLVLDRGAHD